MSTTLSLDEIRKVVREEVRAAMVPTARPMTASETCKYLGVSRTTLQAWMGSRRIPTRRMNGTGRLYFFRNELDEALRRFGRKAVWS